MSLRFSAIDIGSNAIRLLIVEQTPTGYTVLKKDRIAVRLGADAFEFGALSIETFALVLSAFVKFQKIHRKFNVQSYLAFGTSALRDSQNAKVLIKEVFKKTRIKIRVIDGNTEGELIRDAIFKDLPLLDGSSLFIDIGGGSVEFTFNQNSKMLATRSFKIGTVRTLQKMKEQPSGVVLAEYKKLIAPFIQRNLKNPVIRKNPPKMAVGSGGNIEFMGKLKVEVLKKTPNTFLTLAEVRTLYKMIKPLSVEKRITQFNMRPDRADVIVPALQVLMLSMELAKVTKIYIPYVGLREGIILKLL